MVTKAVINAARFEEENIWQERRISNSNRRKKCDSCKYSPLLRWEKWLYITPTILFV